MKVIPAVNSKTRKDAEEKIKKAAEIFAALPADLSAKTLVSAEASAKEGWIHLDIVDGKFAPNKTWGTPDELKQIATSDPASTSRGEAGKRQETSLKFEVHLMIINPEEVIEDWLKTGVVKRVIVHIEAMTDPEKIVKICGQYGAEAMLAEGPDISPSQLPLHKDRFRSFQILGVTAGKAGQKLRPEVIKKVRLLRESLPDVRIEVDGGVNPATGKLAKDAGADILVSASYIFGASDPKEAYNNLARI